MNKEAIAGEMNGQMAKLIENFQRKEEVYKKIRNAEEELKDIEMMIKESLGILQTLQFILTTDGFTKLPKPEQNMPNVIDNQISNKDNL